MGSEWRRWEEGGDGTTGGSVYVTLIFFQCNSARPKVTNRNSTMTFTVKMVIEFNLVVLIASFYKYSLHPSKDVM